MFHRFGRCNFQCSWRAVRASSPLLKERVLCECLQDSMAPHRLRAKAVRRVLRTLVAPFFAANAVETTDCHSPGRGFKSRRQRQTCCSSVRLERVPASPQALFQRFGRRIFLLSGSTNARRNSIDPPRGVSGFESRRLVQARCWPGGERPMVKLDLNRFRQFLSWSLVSCTVMKVSG